MDKLFTQIELVAIELSQELQRSQQKIVFAESCTAGLVAASLARVPGISAWMCGSAVTYRESVKTAWLHVDPEMLAKNTAVSESVTREMAFSVLEKTPEADLAVSVTGHLGPGVDAEWDGLGFVAIAIRKTISAECVSAIRFQMQETSRVHRQFETAMLVLKIATKFLRDQVS
jgi:PncC family amidohydrolase